jgi:hypothetical protein
MAYIPIYLGTEPGQWLIAEMLKSCILRRTKSEVQFKEVRIFPPKVRIRVNIGLAFHRFYIPEACHYQGRAIYMDAHALCLGDILELYNYNMGDRGALALPMDKSGLARHTNVMLMDCARLQDWKVEEWLHQIDRNPALVREYAGVTPQAPFAKDFGDLPYAWNRMNKLEPETKLLFFNDPFNQPWRNPDHPEKELFLKELSQAVQAHHIPRDAIQREIDAGCVYPNLLQDV